MSESILSYLTQRSETSGLLCPVSLPDTFAELFPDCEAVFPRPYKIFFADESVTPVLGFPVRDSAVLRELDARLGQWLRLETEWQITRDTSKKPADQALGAYLSHLVQVAENAMLSNLLSDYHAVFWLTHSLQLARHFSLVKKNVMAIDTKAGRLRGDQLRYRVFSRWVVDTREQMTQLALRTGQLLEGEEERALKFFRILQENVLILTEEFVSPDLRELRSFVSGYLGQDYFSFKEKFERLRTVTNDLLGQDRTFRGAVELFLAGPAREVNAALLLDRRFQKFAFSLPQVEAELVDEDRELFEQLSRRVGGFAILHQLRRGVHWMTSEADGEILSTDRRQEIRYAKSTRPIDFGHTGVVDPMVHRFGLMYDITSFSETLGSLAKAGSKGELGSYRQMLLFQRRLEAITSRHNLILEKFLGDGAFYTSRQALPMLRAAVEIQRFYREMKQKGFAFNKGLRIAVNYGYYRLLPMRGNLNSPEKTMEFYGPGVVELSRLTTGKASKEIEEIESFLIAHGYSLTEVQQFFAPLLRAPDRNDHHQEGREFHAYVNPNGHLINEGIVASFELLEELSAEITDESLPLYRIHTPWATYLGFRPEVEFLGFIGIRLIGTVSLKGLEKIELGEIVPVEKGEYDAELVEEHGSLVTLLRQEYHDVPEDLPPPIEEEYNFDPLSTVLELVLSAKDNDTDGGIIIGEWDPRSDELRRAIRIPRSDLESLLSIEGTLTREALEENRRLLQQIYRKMRDHEDLPTMKLDALRRQQNFSAFLLGEGSPRDEVAP